MTDSLALSGLKCVAENLISAYTTGCEDVEVRASMAYASFISGVTLANAGLGIVHGFAASIGGFFAIPHGVVCGSLLAPSMRVTMANSKKIPSYARLLFESSRWLERFLANAHQRISRAVATDWWRNSTS